MSAASKKSKTQQLKERWENGELDCGAMTPEFIKGLSPRELGMLGELITIDYFNERDVVKGDAKIACIAAASIMAKVTRDEMMVEYDAEYPEYHLAESKGYASPEHIEAIRKHGLCPLHRVSFCGNFLQTERLF